MNSTDELRDKVNNFRNLVNIRVQNKERIQGLSQSYRLEKLSDERLEDIVNNITDLI